MRSVAGLQFWDWYGDGSVYVVDIGLACCTLEFEAAAHSRRKATFDAATEIPAGARVVVVVSGTVTDRLTPAVEAIVDRVRRVHPTAAVVAFGACASAGGPYWDSYAVTKGIDEVLPVDAYVPGCPPPPQALTRIITDLATPAHA